MCAAMKRDRKAEILEVAGRLFETSGGRAFSMRSIAAELGISVGNLTYHFPQKKDLLEAIMRDRHERCRAMPPPATLSELDCFFRALLHRRTQSPPFELCDAPETARELQKLAADHIGELLAGALDALEAAGLLRPDPARPAVEQALLALLLLGRPAEAFGPDPTPEETRRCVWGVLGLLLTGTGRIELEKVI